VPQKSAPYSLKIAPNLPIALTAHQVRTRLGVQSLVLSHPSTLNSPQEFQTRIRLHRLVVHNLQVLLRGIASSSLESDPEERQVFRNRINRVLLSFDEGCFAEDLDSLITETLFALNEYHRHVGADFQKLIAELRAMLCAMTDTLIFLSASSAGSVKQLNLVESKLQQLATVTDAEKARSLLEECLCLVRSEANHAQSHTAVKLASLQAEVDRLVNHVNSAGSDQSSHDKVTLLPNRADAETAINERVCRGEEFVSALFVVDSMVSINNRFGRAAGDDILRKVAQYIAQTLGGATLYRWTGPAFLALFDCKLIPVICEGRAKRVASFRLEESLEKGDRTVLMVVSCSLHLDRLSSKHPPETVIRRIEEFVAAHWSNNTSPN